MNAVLIEHIETTAERAASAAFAGACGFAVYGAFGDGPFQPELGLGMGVAALISYALCRSSLEVLGQGDRRFTVRVFDVRDIETMDDELLLTDADRLNAAELVLTEADRLRTTDQPLELNDILHELAPDARVVRLFDRKAMPTPAQLKSRIDRHLGQAPPRPLSDASQALSEALAELRRSLR